MRIGDLHVYLWLRLILKSDKVKILIFFLFLFSFWAYKRHDNIVNLISSNFLQIFLKKDLNFELFDISKFFFYF